MMGTLEPYTSASSRPTLWPSFCSASARLTATVVLPTPPLPEATATRFLTPGMGWRSGIGCGADPGGMFSALSGVREKQIPRFARNDTKPEQIKMHGSKDPPLQRRTGKIACATKTDYALRPWHFLYFLPEPQGQGSLRPTLAPARTGLGGSACAAPV